MKHLFASCAVIALMATPAYAQSTTEPTGPVVPSEQMLDPTMRDPATTSDPANPVPPDFEAPGTDDPASSPAPTAENGPAANDAMRAETQTDETDTESYDASAQDSNTQDTNAQTAAAQDDASAMGAAETAFQAETMTNAPQFGATIDVQTLPAEYSTDDLNAMMLQQMNASSMRFSQANPSATTYASNDTGAGSSFETTGTSSSGEMNSTSSNMSTDDGQTGETSTVMATVQGAPGSASSDMASNDMANSDMTGSAGTVSGTGSNSASMAGQMETATSGAATANSNMTQNATAEGDIDQTAVEIAAGDPRFSTLVELVGIAGLESALSAEGPYTIFAPTNEAFAELPEATLTRLRSEAGRDELAEILQAHVVNGAVLATEVPLAGRSLQTIGDDTLNVTGSTDGQLTVQGSSTIGDGIYASNGVVYAVDAVILPEADAMDAATE